MKLVKSLLFANVKCYWLRNETRKSLFANVKLVRACYLQIRNVIGHGVKLVKSLLFANVKCYWPRGETRKNLLFANVKLARVCAICTECEWPRSETATE